MTTQITGPLHCSAEMAAHDRHPSSQTEHRRRNISSRLFNTSTAATAATTTTRRQWSCQEILLLLVLVQIILLPTRHHNSIFVLGASDIPSKRSNIPPPPPPPPLPRKKTANQKQKESTTATTSESTKHKAKKNEKESRTALEPESQRQHDSKRVKNTTSSSKSTNNTAANNTLAQQDNAPKNETIITVQITETEIWDGSQWRAPGLLSHESLRWTDHDGEPCAPPVQHKVPATAAAWDGDWKILTNAHTRDSFGWEYSHVKPYPWRQRVWLRNATPKPPRKKHDKKKRTSSSSQKTATDDDASSDQEPVVKSKKPVKKKKRKGTTMITTATERLPFLVSKNRRLPRLIRSMTDDFNFKGFGMGFWKSAVFAKSFGVSFRLPILSNFNRWDGNPNLPLLNVVVGFFYPPLVALSVSSSMPLSSLKFVCAYLYQLSFYLLLYGLWTFYRGLLLAASAVAFPLTRQLCNPPFPLAAPWETAKRPLFDQDISERVGCLYGWKFSVERGYHHEGKVFHYYGHTVSSLWNRKIFASILPKQVPAWITQRTARMGFEVLGPLRNEPYLTCSTGLGLSGIYLRPNAGLRYASAATTILAEEQEAKRTKTSTQQQQQQQQQQDSSSMESEALENEPTSPLLASGDVATKDANDLTKVSSG